MTSFVLLLAAALSAGNAEFDRTAAEGAARITARRFATELAAKGPQEARLKEAMLTDPAAHATTVCSSDKCRLLFTDAARREFDAACREIRRRLALPDDFKLEWTEADDRKVDEIFPQAFQVAREAAVAEQAKTIVATIRPTEADFESRPEKDLRALLTERVAKDQAQPVFEENKIYISRKNIDPMMKGAYETRQRQRDYLRRVRCDAISPSRLTAELTERLSDYVADRQKKEKDAARAWGVFPSVLKETVPAVVERRTLKRLIDQIEALPLVVDAASLEAEIAKDPASHIKKQASEKMFADVYRKKILTEAQAAAVKEAPPNERDEMATYLTERLSDDSVTKAIRETVNRDLMPKWKAAREVLASRQMDRLWPTLAKGTWYPSADLADETVARSDYTATVRNWRQVAALGDLATVDREKPVLEETGAQVDAQVAQAFDRARSAIAAQTKIVDLVFPGALAELNSGSTRPKHQAIVERLTELTWENWQASRVATLWPDGKTPENAADQHRDLFPSVRRKIELLAKTALADLVEPTPEKEPEEPPSEETPSDSTSEETPQEFAWTISVSKKDGRLSVKLLSGKTPVVERDVEEKRAPFDSAMRDVTDRLGRDFLKLK